LTADSGPSYCLVTDHGWPRLRRQVAPGALDEKVRPARSAMPRPASSRV